MPDKKNKSISLKKYKKKKEMNLGIFLFAVIFIYLLITVIMYLSDDSISVYEVREGSIVKDNSYTGLVIRSETAVNAEESGYINYYHNENSKVKAGSSIYALSAEKLEYGSEDAQSASALPADSDTFSGIVLQVQNFNENYKPADYSSVYSLINEIDTTLQNAYSSTRTQQLDALIAASGQTVTVYPTLQDGIVAYSVDGMESITKDSFTADDFDRSGYHSVLLEDQMKISKGDPVYKLITGEDWSIIVQLDRQTAEMFKSDEISSVKVRIEKDNESLWADLEIIQKDGDYYGCLNFDNSMIRYSGERYLSLELILEDESGLKIPKSSVVEKKFYVVPEDFITTGGNSSSDGVLAEQRDGSAEFMKVEVYDISEDGDAYIDQDSLEEGTVIFKPDSSETYSIGKTKTLQGVYNINKGYAVFKKVTILCENDEYYIVEEGESYGLSNYDHIVQIGDSVDSDEVVFQ